VAPINDVPVAAADGFFVAEDDTLTVAAPGVLANDGDADGGNLQALLIGAPTHGMATLNATAASRTRRVELSAAATSLLQGERRHRGLQTWRPCRSPSSR